MTKPTPKSPRQSKTARVSYMLARAEGANLEELCKATGWQAHTVRATLNGLRKAGHMVERHKEDSGQSVYRITSPAETGQ